MFYSFSLNIVSSSSAECLCCFFRVPHLTSLMYVRNASTLPDNNTAAERDRQEFMMVLNHSPLDIISLISHYKVPVHKSV